MSVEGGVNLGYVRSIKIIHLGVSGRPNLYYNNSVGPLPFGPMNFGQMTLNHLNALIELSGVKISGFKHFLLFSNISAKKWLTSKDF